MVPLSVVGKSAKIKIMEQAAKVIETADEIDLLIQNLRDTITTVKNNEISIGKTIKEKFSS